MGPSWIAILSTACLHARVSYELSCTAGGNRKWHQRDKASSPVSFGGHHCTTDPDGIGEGKCQEGQSIKS
eukprot:7543566-Karenia_brevis.AAC.1